MVYKGELDLYAPLLKIQDREGDPFIFVESEKAIRKSCPNCKSLSLIDGEVSIQFARCQLCQGFFVSHERLLDIKDPRRADYPIGPAILDLLNVLSSP